MENVNLTFYKCRKLFIFLQPAGVILSVCVCVCLTVELLRLLRLHPCELVLLTRLVLRHLRQKTEGDD